MDILKTYFTVIAFVLPLFLIWPIVRLFLRVRMAQEILARPLEQREKLTRIHRSQLALMRLSLWMVPITAVLLAAVNWFLPGTVPWVMFVVGAEGMVWVVLQYFFEKWLIRYVTEHERAAPT